MFYPLTHFSALEKIAAQAGVIAGEFAAQREKLPILSEFMNCKPGTSLTSHIDYWAQESSITPEEIGYKDEDVAVVALPLYKTGFPVKQFDVAASFPKTYELLLNVPGINFAAFFRLAPDYEVLEHAHSQANYIFHLCLFDIDGSSVMRCDGHEKILKKQGDYCLFDYSKPHSSFNSAKDDRINLVVDFTPQPLN